MREFWNTKERAGRLLLVAATACAVLGGCARFEESGLPGSASSIARNQIMYVSEQPQTFGFQRLTTQMKAYPDLHVFVEQRGLPEFLAEARSQNQDYFILYYLARKQAFACRNRIGQARSLEFSGPYPITERESRTLEGFRAKAVR